MTDTETIELAHLERAVRRLPRLHAVIFFAVCHDKLSFAETGKQVSRPTEQVKRIYADAMYRLHLDVWEQKRGVVVGPIHRFLRERHLNLRLRYRVWRNRW